MHSSCLRPFGQKALADPRNQADFTFRRVQQIIDVSIPKLAQSHGLILTTPQCCDDCSNGVFNPWRVPKCGFDLILHLADNTLLAPVQPTRASVSIKVLRGIAKLRQTAALLLPLSRAARMASNFSESTACGRPPYRPRRLAAARPALTRSFVSARSYWA